MRATEQIRKLNNSISEVKGSSLDPEWMLLIVFPASVSIRWVLIVTYVDKRMDGWLGHLSICTNGVGKTMTVFLRRAQKMTLQG